MVLMFVSQCIEHTEHTEYPDAAPEACVESRLHERVHKTFEGERLNKPRCANPHGMDPAKKPARPNESILASL